MWDLRAVTEMPRVCRHDISNFEEWSKPVRCLSLTAGVGFVLKTI